MKRTLFVLASYFALTSSAFAQQFVCENIETVAMCRTRLESTLGTTRKATVTNSQDAVKKKTETGLEDLATGLSSSVKDFLPLLQMSGVLGNATTDDQTGVVTVALNTPMLGTGRLTKDNAFQAKALIETKPKLFDPIRQALPESGRDALEKDLLAVPNRQSVTVQLTGNITTKRLGRNFNQYRDVVQSLYEGILSPASKTAKSMAEQKVLEDALDAAERTDGTKNGKIDVLDTTRMLDIPARPGLTRDERRVEIETALIRVVEHGFAMNAAFDAEIKASGLDFFGQMVNNQPQWHFEFAYASRDDIFGPDQVSGRMTFETGFDNSVNSFLDEAGTACANYSSTTCVAALKKFTSSQETRAAIKAGSRVSVFLEVVRSDAYAYHVSANNVDLNFDATTKVNGGVDFGRLLGVADDGSASARVDASAGFDWSSDETVAKNRLVASVTLTKKFGEMSIPFGIRYASETEFLSDFDHQLSAHVGLKFNLFPGNQ